MIATTAQAATTEVVYVIPLGWTVVLGVVILLAVGAILGAWATTRVLDDDVEDRIDRGIRSGIAAHLEERRKLRGDTDAMRVLAILLGRLGGDVELTLRELAEVDRDATLWAHETRDGLRLTIDRFGR